MRYTDVLRRCSGPILLGVPEALVEAFPAHAHVVRSSKGAPVIIPIELLSWWSPSFFQEWQGGELEGRTFFVEWDLWRDSLPELASSASLPCPMLWVTEVPDDELEAADRTVIAMARQLGTQARPVPLLSSGDAIEDYFVLETRLQTPGRNRFDPLAEWRHMVQAGDAVDNDPSGCSVLIDPTPADTDEVWDVYSRSMLELSRTHPVRAELDRDAFDDLARGSGGCIAVGRVDGRVVSAAVLGVGVGAFDWLDTRWFDELQSTSDASDLVIWPAIATEPSLRNQGLILSLLDLIGRLILRCDSQLLIVFPCDNTSVEDTPHIAQAAVDAQGDLMSGIVRRACGYVFRGYEIA